VRLLNRTTRSVALTDAGELLLQRIEPALTELGVALDDLNVFRDEPVGTLRLSVSSLGLSIVLAPVLGRFMEAYPDISLDVVVDDDVADLVETRRDAGIRNQMRIPQDMVAQRISPPSRFVAAASPDYLRRRGRPCAPADLMEHNCIRFRFASGALYNWQFEEDGRLTELAVNGTLITDNADLMRQAALQGVGVTYMVEDYIQGDIEAGRLAVVLEDFATPFPGWFIYYPEGRHRPLPLTVFTAFLRAHYHPSAEGVQPSPPDRRRGAVSMAPERLHQAHHRRQ
jgi:DNA-binding transcriptional LysR family regulator